MQITTSTKYLNERERANYLSVLYPYIVPYFGYIELKEKKLILLEYVEGQTLLDYVLTKLSTRDKYSIIFEMLLTIRYLHSKEFIYRDLKLNNIIINQGKDEVLIDFDRLINIHEARKEEFTQNFANPAAAPGIIKTYKSDIHSLRYVVYYILYGFAPVKINDEFQIDQGYIFEDCLENDSDERQDISYLIYIFYIQCLSKIEFKGEKEIFSKKIR